MLVLLIPGDVLKAKSKTDDTIYYTALGDSVSAGTEHTSFFMEHPSAYPNLLSNKLRNSGKCVILDNQSIPGATTEDLLYWLDNDTLVQEAVKKANLITISIGGNNILFAGVRSGYTEIYDNTAKEGVDSFCDDLPRIIDKINSLNKNNPEILIMNLYNTYHPLEWGSVIFEDGRSEEGFLHDMIYKNYISVMQDKLIELSKKNKNLKVVDTYKCFENSSRFSNVMAIPALGSKDVIIYSPYFSKGTSCTDAYTNFYKYPYEPFNLPFLRDLHPSNTGQEIIAEADRKSVV